MYISIPIKNLFITDGNKCSVWEILENADTMAKQKDIWQNRNDPRTSTKILEGTAFQEYKTTDFTLFTISHIEETRHLCKLIKK